MRKTEQLNFRLTKDEKLEIERRASERDQTIPEFMRDLLRFGMLPETIARR